MKNLLLQGASWRDIVAYVKRMLSVSCQHDSITRRLRDDNETITPVSQSPSKSAVSLLTLHHFAACLLMLFVLGVGNVWAYTGTFTNYTNATLIDGYYIICPSTSASNTNYCAGTTVSSSRITGNSLTSKTNPANAYVWIIENTASGWTFNNYGTSTKYIRQKGTSSGGGMEVNTTIGYFTLAGYNSTSPVGYKFTSADQNSNNQLKWNNSNKWFANYANAYSNSMTPVCLYRDNTKYRAKTTQPATGSFTASATNATWDTPKKHLSWVASTATVTLTATPPSGKEVNAWTVTKASGGTVTVTSTGTNTATFSMPADQVTVTVTWKDAASSCDADPTVGAASINGSFTLTSLTGTVSVNCSGSSTGSASCHWADRGYVWSLGTTTTTPTVSNNKVAGGNGDQATGWAGSITPSGSTTPTAWEVGKTYYIRAYGKNETTGAEFAYGMAASFTLRSITYNSNGGTTVNTQYVNSGGTYSAPTAPTKTGYTFGGCWYTDDGTFANAMDWSSAITANKELYAKWTANSYTVAFNANGGTGDAMASQSFDYDETKTLSKNTYLPPAGSHKYFLGWNTNSAATTATYTDEQSVSNLTSTDGATVTLYAIWKEHTYTNYRTNCCEKPTITINGTGKTVEDGKIVFPLLREDLGGAATTTWATLDITFSSNSAGAFTVITNSSKTAAKLSTWQSRATTGGTWAAATHAKFEITSAGNARFSVKTTDGYTGQGTYRIGLHQDANGDHCATDTYIFVDVTLRDKFVDQLNDNGTVNRDGHGAQLATPTLSQLPSQDEDACHDEERKLKGWIKETDLKTLYENGTPASTRVQTIDGLCESCDPASDQKSLVVAPGDNITTSGATWYAVWAYEK